MYKRQVYGDGPYVGRYDADGDGNIWQPTQFQVNSAGQHTLSLIHISITGLDGDFSLSNVKKGDIIVISFVGYQTQEVKRCV